MTPTSRNSLMIGGGLIVIALLLTCGPMRGLFGDADPAAVTESPSVAASPPEEAPSPSVAVGPPEEAPAPADAADAMASAAAAGDGAANGAEAGTNGAAVAGLDGGAAAGEEIVVFAAAEAEAAGAGVAMPTAEAVGAGVGAATAAGADAGSGFGAAATKTVSAPPKPPVSGGPSAVAVANTSGANAAASAAAATNAFDDAYASLSGDGVDAAGKVVDRFAPPVAAVASGGLAFNGAQRSIGSSIGGVRQPCDSPGAGCRNTVTPASPLAPANPPIVGGTRPGRRGVAE